MRFRFKPKIPTETDILKMKPAYVSRGISEGVVLPDTSKYTSGDIARMIKLGQQSGQVRMMLAPLQPFGFEEEQSLAERAKRLEYERHLAEDDEIPL